MKQKNIRLKKSLTPEKLRSHLSRFFIKTKLVTNFVYILIKLEINKQSSNLINNLNQNVIPFSANLTSNKTTLKK